MLLSGCGSNLDSASSPASPEPLIARTEAAATAAPSPIPTPTPANLQAAVGTNVGSGGGVSYWTPEWIFPDVFKSAGEWRPMRNWVFDPNIRLDIDANGWIRSLEPGVIVGAPMMIAQPDSWDWPRGNYTLLYEGEGQIDLNNTRIVSREPGRIVAEVTGPVQLILRSTNPQNYVRNIRFMMPGYENNQAIFHPLFLERLKHYKTLRFVHWMKSAHNPPERLRWNERTTLTSYTQTGPNGPAPEYMIALANRLHCNPWFCFPHSADDEYIRQFARMVKAKLDPSLTAYVEYANEVWNGQYPATRHAQAEGVARGYSINPGEAGLRYYATRSKEVFAIWEQEYGGRSSRFKTVLATQFGDWNVRTVVGWQDAWRSADCVAVAPYFGLPWDQVNYAHNLTVDQVIAGCQDYIDNNIAPMLIRIGQTAQSFGLELVAYEAGQHLASFGPAQTDPVLISLYTTTNRDPRMADLYHRYLNLWRRAGGHLMVHFNSVSRYDQFGSFGVLERQSQDPQTAPKWRALTSWMALNPQWW